MHTNEYFGIKYTSHKNCNTSPPAINFAAQGNICCGSNYRIILPTDMTLTMKCA